LIGAMLCALIALTAFMMVLNKNKP
jgi:hypothetical protein